MTSAGVYLSEPAVLVFAASVLIAVAAAAVIGVFFCYSRGACCFAKRRRGDDENSATGMRSVGTLTDQAKHSPVAVPAHDPRLEAEAMAGGDHPRFFVVPEATTERAEHGSGTASHFATIYQWREVAADARIALEAAGEGLADPTPVVEWLPPGGEDGPEDMTGLGPPTTVLGNHSHFATAGLSAASWRRPELTSPVAAPADPPGLHYNALHPFHDASLGLNAPLHRPAAHGTLGTTTPSAEPSPSPVYHPPPPIPPWAHDVHAAPERPRVPPPQRRHSDDDSVPPPPKRTMSGGDRPFAALGSNGSFGRREAAALSALDGRGDVPPAVLPSVHLPHKNSSSSLLRRDTAGRLSPHSVPPLAAVPEPHDL